MYVLAYVHWMKKIHKKSVQFVGRFWLYLVFVYILSHKTIKNSYATPNPVKTRSGSNGNYTAYAVRSLWYFWFFVPFCYTNICDL